MISEAHPFHYMTSLHIAWTTTEEIFFFVRRHLNGGKLSKEYLTRCTRNMHRFFLSPISLFLSIVLSWMISFCMGRVLLHFISHILRREFLFIVRGAHGLCHMHLYTITHAQIVICSARETLLFYKLVSACRIAVHQQPKLAAAAAA